METLGKICYIIGIVTAVAVGSMFTTRTANDILTMEKMRSGANCHIGSWEYPDCSIDEPKCDRDQRTITLSGNNYACKEPFKDKFNNRFCYGKNKIKYNHQGFCDYTPNCEKE